MSLDPLVLNRNIRRVVELCTGMAPGDVRPANQMTGDTTSGSYATVLVMNYDGSVASQDWADVPNDAQKRVQETQNRHVMIRVSIQMFRRSALQFANKLRDRITLTSALQLMQSLGLGYIQAGPVRDLTKVVNENWEERAAVDVDFYLVSTDVDVVATYGTFPVTVSTDNSSTTTEVYEP